VKTYYKGYSNFWTGRQYVIEYEEINNGELGSGGQDKHIINRRQGQLDFGL